MGYIFSLLILATQAFVTILPNPVAVPAPFPGGVGPDGTRYKTAYKCEGESLEISCASDQTIKIIRANFGRFSIAICNRQGTTDMSVNCMSPASNRVMKKKCDGFNSCAINISSSEFGDPCPATPKYLEVHYGCVPKTSPTTKKPLPAWFLAGGSEQLWETGRERIPDPPEGFQTEEESRAETGGAGLLAELTTVETRIPITTPTGTSPEPTTTTTRPTTPRTTSSSTSRPAQVITQEPELYTDNSIPEMTVELVDIPQSEQALHCPPTVSRSLAWNWTLAGETAIQPCPPGTTGLARWSCPPLLSHTAAPAWAGTQPDMSDCRSLALTELESGVERGDLENVLSASLAHHTNTHLLYGGDVESAVAIIRTLASRIQYLLQTQGEKFYNKSQYIQEVLLNMVRAASNLLDSENREAWTDLHPSRQIKSASALMSALQENAFLFVSVTDTQEILVESSNNILMSASIMEIGRLTNGTTLPLSEYEEPYGQVLNTITIPFNVLWTEARGGITKLLHFSFRNLEDILGQAEVEFSEQQQEEEQLLINSRIISAAFGASRSEVEFPDSLTVSLSHLSRLGPGERSVCVWWDSRVTAWSRAGCHLLSSSPSHSECSCHSLAPLAVLRTAGPAQSPQSSSLPILTLQIVTYIVAAISVVCVVLILVKFRRNIQKVLYKTPCLSQEEKHACNPRSRSCLNMGLSQDKNSTAAITLQNSLLHRPAVPACTLSPQVRRSPEGAGQDSGLAAIQPNLYRTTFENGQPVMVTLNPYSNQLVDNINKMMGDNLCYDTAMNPQLAKLTATLRKKQMVEPRLTENPALQLTERQGGCMFQGGRMVDPSDVVFRAVSPHGHVYWEINPKQGHHQQKQQQHQQHPGSGRCQTSSSDENTNSDLQNISDLSDDDNRAASEMSRQSSSRFSESRPLIYSSSSSSTSPGHSATPEQLQYHQARQGPAKLVARPRYQDEVYAYAATDFSSGQQGVVPEQVQSQVQIRDCRAVPVSVKSKEYIMAKIADYTERQSHQV